MNETVIIPDEIIRSRRKTLSIIIDSNARLIVRAPMRLSRKSIDEFIYKKAKWITSKKQDALNRNEQIHPYTLKNNTEFLYLGKRHTILRREIKHITLEGDHLIVPTDMNLNSFIKKMKEQARATITKRVIHYSSIMGVEYTSIKMSGAKTRWGSCSASNALNFTWRLIMCPLEVIDYVVVHELSHITHKNHSAKFWANVERYMSNYKVMRSYLKENQRLMDII
jgi:predicted metal-dependent hydrolase